MSDRGASMKTAKRRINHEKHERVAAVIAQIKAQGRNDQLTPTTIARRAGVHRSFVSNHFAAQIAHAEAEIQSRFIAGLSGQTALSAASLRVEMETAKHQAREAHKEIRGLKTRLARTLGEEVAAEHSEHSVPSALVKDLHAQVAQLVGAQDDLRRQLREAEEELEASRRLNRTLIRERNSNPTEASGSGC
jgi:AraC-like DNA-binding protein